MPPKITEVKWSAENVPLGMSFNENTGTFSGEPEEAGEYTVPVTVETNYGIDTKDVIITIEPPTYGVYAMGNMAPFWSNEMEPDIDGFYELPIPNMEKLSYWANGFRAYTSMPNKTIYGCGHTGIAMNTSGYWVFDRSDLKDFTFKKEEYSSSANITRYISSFYYGTNESVYTIATITANNELTIANSLLYPYYKYVAASTSAPAHYQMWGTSSTSMGGVANIPISQVDLLPNGQRGWHWLSEDGTQYTIMTLVRTKSSTYTSPAMGSIKLETQDIGYIAKKILSSTNFTFLSKSGYLDNNPDNFPHGIIKDAWCFNGITYVQTISNQLYMYDADSNAWNLLGTYDIKKIMYILGQMYVLTNDAKLYHKGNNLIEKIRNDSNKLENYECIPEHDVLTHVFPAQQFKDFTVCYGTALTLSGNVTLIVLKE